MIHEFERMDEDVELAPILDDLEARPPLDPSCGHKTRGPVASSRLGPTAVLA